MNCPFKDSTRESEVTVSSKKVHAADITADIDSATESLRVLLLAPQVIPDPAEASQFLQYAASLPAADQIESDTISLPTCQIRKLGLFSCLVGFMSSFERLLTAIPGYDIVHLFHFSGRPFLLYTAPMVVLVKFFGKKVVLNYADCLAEPDLERAHEIYRPILRLCDQITVSSHYLRSVLSGYRYASEVMPVGIADPVSDPEPISAVQPRIVMVGPLERQAGHAVAIRAFKLVKQKYPRAELVVVGDGIRRQYLQNLVRRENIHGVTFEPYINPSRVKQVIADADLFLNSSIYDSIPAAILQALAAGRPIVSTDTGGISEIIRDRQNGLLVRVNDFSGMADRIIELIENPNLVSSLSRAALETADRFSAERIRENWHTLYNRLL